MLKFLHTATLCFLPGLIFAQERGNFPEFKPTKEEFSAQFYPLDTSAVAVVLDEFGKAYFNSGSDYNLVFEHHVKIKIFKKEGLEYANIEIPLYKLSEFQREKLKVFEAVSFNEENGSVRQTNVGIGNTFTDQKNKKYDIVKVAIPNVRVGSIVEFKYTIETPFYYNYRTWTFQSEIPKVYSEYWASIPENFLYNISLKGFYPLTTNASKVEKQCYWGNGRASDCSVFMYAMKDIPAFIEEEFMTAKSNFLSSINFELAEYRYFNGKIDKITKEWKDVESELRKNDSFGAQLRKADGKIKSDVQTLVAGEIDPLTKAKKVYYHILQNFEWNGKHNLFTDVGVKKAYENKIGNVADINMLLIAALDVAGIPVDPVILSTRDNGVPIELHPVIADFNYIVARANINGKFYLLDATDQFHPFGLLPERCLNGKGRVLGETESFWIDMVSPDKSRRISNFTLKLSENGLMSGGLQITYMGYEAVRQRKAIQMRATQSEYIEDLIKTFDGAELNKFDIVNFTEVEKPLVVKLDINYQAYDDESAENFLFNPFIIDRQAENPFKSNQRLYPVDFGSPREFTTMLNLEFPEKYEIVNKPEKMALSLPNAGGRFLLDLQIANNKLIMSNALTINRTVFSSEEYLFLKELYSRIIQAQNEDLIFKAKI